MTTLWVDVEDLLEFVERTGRPSGIQRVTYEICAALQAREDAAHRVRFVRHDAAHNGFATVPWDEVAATLRGAGHAPPGPSLPTHSPTDTVAGYSRGRMWLRRQVQRLPGSIKVAVLRALRASLEAARAWASLAAILLAWVRLRLLHRRKAAHHGGTHRLLPRRPMMDEAVAGDIILALGAPWQHPDYAALIRPHRALGLRFALLVHDLIPLRHPEWCDAGVVRRHTYFANSVLPLCDFVFANSRATAADVEAYARENGFALPRPVLALQMGTGFGPTDAPVHAQRTARLPPPGSYAMLVSTIEARKNHMLLFRVWRQLLRDLPRDQVPTLVFAGREGWLVRDLMQQIANSNHLDGKLLLIDGPSDAELAALYQGCLFTLFPSLAEGWGLPVTESLAFGKPCLTANNTSLPEAGMGLARCFDADNLHDAIAKIRAVIEHPAELAAWEARIHAEFRPVGWGVAAAALLREVDTASAAAAGSSDP